MFGKKAKAPQTLYAFCERATAGPESPHHIRPLTDIGMKKSGGADTAALCGATVAWDVDEVLLQDIEGLLPTQHATWRICTVCAEAGIALA